MGKEGLKKIICVKAWKSLKYIRLAGNSTRQGFRDYWGKPWMLHNGDPGGGHNDLTSSSQLLKTHWPGGP